MTASLGNFTNPPYATQIDAFVYPQFLYWQRTPTTNDVYPAGTRVINTTLNPPIIYESAGAGVWLQGGNDPATTTTQGIVQLSTFGQLSTGTAPAGPVAPVAPAGIPMSIA